MAEIHITFTIENGVELYFQTQDNVTEINLSGRNIVDIDLSQLIQCKTLREVNLSANLIRIINLEPLMECPSLERLNLSSNLISSIDLSGLSSNDFSSEINSKSNEIFSTYYFFNKFYLRKLCWRRRFTLRVIFLGKINIEFI